MTTPPRRRKQKQVSLPIDIPAVDRPGWLNTSVDPTSKDPATMPELALRTLCNALFSSCSPAEKTYTRLRVDLLQEQGAAAEAAGVNVERARQLDAGIVANVKAYRKRTPVIDRNAVMESYSKLYQVAESKGAAGVRDCVKILEKICELGGISGPAADTTLLDATGPAEDIARSALEHLVQGKITSEDAARLMGATKNASEVAINNRLADPGNSDNPHESGSVPFAAVELMKRQSAVLDKLLAARSKIPLEIQHNEE